MGGGLCNFRANVSFKYKDQSRILPGRVSVQELKLSYRNMGISLHIVNDRVMTVT